ncbi:MAG: HYR domain-containing protein, partial [Proteobacteria bacterium]|nr:HYR domain-containing protein [Pseudomonadota bacterium]
AASFTYLAASPALTITSDAASCTPVGTTVNMNVTLSGVVQNIVAGQISLAWNPAKLQPAATNPISAGDSPFVVFQSINSAAGTATILVSTTPGSTGAPVQSKVVAKLRFVVAAASCDGTGTSVGFVPSPALPTEFTDGFGAAIIPQLVASSTFVVDDGAPVISNVPANVTVQAQAGEGNFATVSLGTPTVSDACSPTQLTSTRSDGQPLAAKWPVGTTTVTWRAVDPCGNATTATTTVTVQPYNTMSFTASWVNPFGGGAGAVRTRTVNVTVAGNGTASFSVTDLPVDNYSCATLEDVTRSLRRKVAVTDAGSTWAAGNAALVLGDIIADEVVDVLDWGAYVVLNPNADLNSDGVINSTDGNIILANFGVRGDTACGSAFTDAPQPIVAISVQELVRMGLPELAAADLNRDGVLDEVDMEIHQQRGQ